MTFRASAWATALALLAPVPALAATITNHSFEDIPGPLTQGINSALNSWDYFPSIPGWSTGSGEELEIQSANTLTYIDAHSGDNYVELDSSGNNSIFQEISLEAGRHALTFYYSMRNAAVDNRYNGPAADDTNDMSFGISGIFTDTVLGGPGSGFSYGTWSEITTLFDVETAGTYTLSFTGMGTSESYGALIDTISIAHVPLPGAGILLLTALGGMILRKKR